MREHPASLLNAILDFCNYSYSYSKFQQHGLFSCKYSYLKDIVAITVLKVRLIIKCINLRNYRPINDEVLDDLES